MIDGVYMSGRIFKLAVMFSFLVLFSSIGAFAKSFYDVANVKKNDTLTLREKPTYKSKKMGLIPHNYKFLVATGSQELIGKRVWLELNYNGVTGWVNSKYLKKSNGVSFKEELKCLGTEPFWSVDINKGELIFKDLGENATEFLVSNIDISDSHTNKWYLSASSISKGFIRAFLLQTGNCSDDMSDYKYKYQILFHDEKNNLTLSGCCNRY